MTEYYKKIDKSIFKYGITIPNRFKDAVLWDKPIHVGGRRNVTIHWENNKYQAALLNVNRLKSTPVLQLRWDNNKELLTKLKIEFIQSYIAIESQFFETEHKYTNLSSKNQEVLIFRPIKETTIELETFIKVETPYDRLFKRLVEENVFGWLSSQNRDYLITKSTPWYHKKELPKHVDALFVVYYLIDQNRKQIYIGSANRLGDRVKVGRAEIPGWNLFKYEIVHPDYHHLLRRIEYHAINAFAYFLKNNGMIKPYSISDYVLVNKNWSKSR